MAAAARAARPRECAAGPGPVSPGRRPEGEGARGRGGGRAEPGWAVSGWAEPCRAELSRRRAAAPRYTTAAPGPPLRNGVSGAGPAPGCRAPAGPQAAAPGRAGIHRGAAGIGRWGPGAVPGPCRSQRGCAGAAGGARRCGTWCSPQGAGPSPGEGSCAWGARWAPGPAVLRGAGAGTLVFSQPGCPRTRASSSCFILTAGAGLRETSVGF